MEIAYLQELQTQEILKVAKLAQNPKELEKNIAIRGAKVSRDEEGRPTYVVNMTYQRLQAFTYNPTGQMSSHSLLSFVPTNPFGWSRTFKYNPHTRDLTTIVYQAFSPDEDYTPLWFQSCESLIAQLQIDPELHDPTVSLMPTALLVQSGTDVVINFRNGKPKKIAFIGSYISAGNHLD